MPYYDFACLNCSAKQAFYHKIDDRDSPHEHCGLPMARVISSPFIRPDITSYVSPASGKVINSRAQRKNDLAREGCIEAEPGIKKWIHQNHLAQVEKNLETVYAGIDQTVSALHSSGHIPGV